MITIKHYVFTVNGERTGVEVKDCNNEEQNINAAWKRFCDLENISLDTPKEVEEGPSYEKWWD